MERNVYSLVLLDEVVDAVDRAACEQNTSRSGLINRILAEYLSCPIPEMRIGSILDCMEKTLAGAEGLLVRPQPGGSTLTIRSVLRYRYRPTVRYVLERVGAALVRITLSRRKSALRGFGRPV